MTARTNRTTSPTYLQDRNEAIVALLYDAGLRAGEVCALHVDHGNPVHVTDPLIICPFNHEVINTTLFLYWQIHKLGLMPYIEDTYKDEKIVAEGEGAGMSLMINGEEMPLEVDDHGDKTIFSYKGDLYRGYEDVLELAKMIIDEDLDEQIPDSASSTGEE